MNSIQERIFHDIREFEYAHKINVNQSNFNSVIKILNSYNVIFFKSIIAKKIIIYNDNQSYVVKANFIDNKEKYFYNLKLRHDPGATREGVIIGAGLANRLHLDYGDSINIASPIKLDLLTGYIPKEKLSISAIYNLDIFDYDVNYIFLDLEYGETFGFINTFSLLIKDDLSDKVLEELYKYNNNLKISSWNERHREFIDAMNLETMQNTYSSY